MDNNTVISVVGANSKSLQSDLPLQTVVVHRQTSKLRHNLRHAESWSNCKAKHEQLHGILKRSLDTACLCEHEIVEVNPTRSSTDCSNEREYRVSKRSRTAPSARLWETFSDTSFIHFVRFLLEEDISLPIDIFTLASKYVF